MDKTQILKKTAKIAANILLYAFIALCIFGVILSITAKKDPDGTLTIFGKQMRLVLSSSMEACEETDVSMYDIKDIPKRSMIFVEVVPEDEAEAAEWYKDLKIGDVLTFKYVYVRQETITHRVTGILPKDSGYLIRLDGDNKASDADTLTQTIDTSVKNNPNYVIGKVTGQSYLLGLLVSMLKSPVGLIFIVIIPSLAIMAIEVMKVVNILGADKRRELDDLRRRLAELEGQSPDSTSVGSDTNGEAP